MAEEKPINEEKMGIEVILSVLVWLVLMIAAFILVGAVAGVIVILLGAVVLVWWIASIIRK